MCNRPDCDYEQYVRVKEQEKLQRDLVAIRAFVERVKARAETSGEYTDDVIAELEAMEKANGRTND